MQKKRIYAFSMIELLIVLGIIGIILAIAIPRIKKSRQVANEIACKAEIDSVKAALELYYTRQRSYPEKIETLVKQDYLGKDAVRDPWGNAYFYHAEYKGKRYTSYNLYSFGEDGIQGTEDDVHPAD